MRGGVNLNNILPIILVDILLLVVFGFIVYKAIQKATQKKVLFLEKEADDLVEKAKREAEATKKEAILEAKEEREYRNTELSDKLMHWRGGDSYNKENALNIFKEYIFLSV